MKLINTKVDDAGIMKVLEDETTTRYEIMTFAGKYRGGKIYFGDKVVQVISGTTTITLEINGIDTEVILIPESEDYIIPAGIPSIFYFPIDTEIVEEFPIRTKTENFKRFREMK